MQTLHLLITVMVIIHLPTHQQVVIPYPIGALVMGIRLQQQALAIHLILTVLMLLF